MAKRNIFRSVAAVLAFGMCMTGLAGCGSEKRADGKTEIEVVSYKPEAVKAFEKIEKRFNETHDDIHLTISSPNEAMTILKTRFIREDYPDIIAIGGDINYSNFLDADLFDDISDLDEVQTVKQAYLDMDKELEFIPKDGTYALPYVANAAGILYNKDLFEENAWKVPTTWQEFTTLCDEIKQSGTLPLYLGFKDTWTCLAPWNAIAADLAPSDVCSEVNKGNTTFTDNYREVAEKEKALLAYAQDNSAAYGYNDACTAFAKGESAMFVIGSYAVPQIKSVNPDMNIDSFVFPASNNAEENVLNSGNDLQFSIMKNCEHKEEAYEVLRFFMEDENVQSYIDDQSAVPCKKGDFELPSMLDGMKEYINEGKLADYQDHHYPSEMSVDAMIQTYLLDDSENATDKFLKKFDTEWVRYNRDLIRKVQDYEKENGSNN